MESLEESLSKSMGNLPGELLIALYMESLRKPFQNQVKVGLERTWSIGLWCPSEIPFKINGKVVWRAPCRFRTISYRFQEIGLESSWSIYIWNPQGIPFQN